MSAGGGTSIAGFDSTVLVAIGFGALMLSMDDEIVVPLPWIDWSWHFGLAGS